MNHLIRKMNRILFLIIFFAGCTPEKNETIALLWQEEKATGILIPQSLLEENSNLQDRLKVQLIQPGERSAILGEIKSEKEFIVFEPLVPFTRGLRYEIVLENKLIGEIEIPKSESLAPELLVIYPSQDTVPENLLKMYFRFSLPMVEDRSLSYITIVNKRDTLLDTFLNLKPELWNTDGTVLTLWLDPGRIKRDLIPNKEKGNPLKSGDRYTLHVSSDWISKDGARLKTSYSKTFTVTKRDEQTPMLERWNILSPKPGTLESLTINLLETLDYSVLMESIQILDVDKNPVSGIINVENEERTFLFSPVAPWKAGEYTIKIESRLEDLAGNNLNRLFDRDVTVEKKADRKFFEKTFTIN